MLIKSQNGVSVDSLYLGSQGAVADTECNANITLDSYVGVSNSPNLGSRSIQNSSGNIRIQLHEVLGEISRSPRRVSIDDLVGITEHVLNRLIRSGDFRSAKVFLHALLDLYTDADDADNVAFASMRLLMLDGHYESALSELYNIKTNKELLDRMPAIEQEIVALKMKHDELAKIHPHLSAIEQMRALVIEKLVLKRARTGEPIVGLGVTKDGIDDYFDGLMQVANVGLDVIADAIKQKKVFSVREGFERFEELLLDAFVEIDEDLRLLGMDDFKRFLELRSVDVDDLFLYSEIESETEREQWLLYYTRELRGELWTSSVCPYRTVKLNLETLRKSRNYRIGSSAEELYQEVIGTSSFTGYSDAEFSETLKSVPQRIAPLVIGAMLAGPIGAYVEGVTANVTISIGGRTLFSAAQLGGARTAVSVASGFGAEGLAFWAGHDASHSMLVGGGEYFTGKSLQSAYMYLGSIRGVMALWGASGGYVSTVAAAKYPRFALPIKATSASGAFAAETMGFVGVNEIQELIGMIPASEKTLRQEIVQSALFLGQLKAGFALGKAVTGNVSMIKTVEVKLDTAQRLLKQALEAGSVTGEIYRAAYNRVATLSTMLSDMTNKMVIVPQGVAMPAAARGGSRVSEATALTGLGGSFDSRGDVFIYSAWQTVNGRETQTSGGNNIMSPFEAARQIQNEGLGNIGYMFVPPLMKLPKAWGFGESILNGERIRDLGWYEEQYSGAGPGIATHHAHRLIQNGTLDAAMIYGLELLHRDPKVYEVYRDQIPQLPSTATYYEGNQQIFGAMNIYRGGQIVPIYDKEAQLFLKKTGMTLPEFYQMADNMHSQNEGVYMNAVGTPNALGSITRKPAGAEVFQISHCAYPYVSYYGGMLLVSERMAEQLSSEASNHMRVSFADSIVAPDGPQHIASISEGRHLKTLSDRLIVHVDATRGQSLGELVDSGDLGLHLYNCFPHVPLKMGRALGLVSDVNSMLKFTRNTQLTVTGGACCGDGYGWNIPSLHAMTTIVAGNGGVTNSAGVLVHSNGGTGGKAGLTWILPAEKNCK
jgi:hypothetical protein